MKALSRLVHLPGLLLVALPALSDAAPYGEKLLEEKIFSVSLLHQGNASGSGFVVKRTGSRLYLLTNAHVVTRETEVVEAIGETWFAYARLVTIDRKNDLALLAIDEFEDQVGTGRRTPIEAIVPFEINDANPRMGDAVAVIGYPYGYPNYQASVTLGQITGVGVIDRTEGMVATDARASPGNSGGPAIDQEGRVIGMLTAGLVGKGMSFLIPAETISSFISQARAGPNVPSPIQFQKALPDAGWAPTWLAASLVSVRRGSRFIGFAVPTAITDGGTLLVGSGFDHPCSNQNLPDDTLPCEAELPIDGGVRFTLSLKGNQVALAQFPPGMVHPVALASKPGRLFTPMLRFPWTGPEETTLIEVPADRATSLTPFDGPLFTEDGKLVARGPATVEELVFDPPTVLRVEMLDHCRVHFSWAKGMGAPTQWLMNVATAAHPVERPVSLQLPAEYVGTEFQLDGCADPRFFALARFFVSPENARSVLKASMAFTSFSWQAKGNAPDVLFLEPGTGKDREPINRAEWFSAKRLDQREIHHFCANEVVTGVSRLKYAGGRQMGAPVRADGFMITAGAQWLPLTPKGSLPAEKIVMPPNFAGCLAADGAVSGLCGVVAARTATEGLARNVKNQLALRRPEGWTPLAISCLPNCQVIGTQAQKNGYLVATWEKDRATVHTLDAKGVVIKALPYAAQTPQAFAPQGCQFDGQAILWCQSAIFGPPGRKLPKPPGPDCSHSFITCMGMPCPQ